jgi:hypothetical protein
LLVLGLPAAFESSRRRCRGWSLCAPAGFGNTTLIAQWLAPGERGEGEGELVITTRADPPLPTRPAPSSAITPHCRKDILVLLANLTGDPDPAIIVHQAR